MCVSIMFLFYCFTLFVFLHLFVTLASHRMTLYYCVTVLVVPSGIIFIITFFLNSLD